MVCVEITLKLWLSYALIYSLLQSLALVHVYIKQKLLKQKFQELFCILPTDVRIKQKSLPHCFQ